MKKLSFLLLSVMFISSLLYMAVLAGDEIKDFKKLVIYIKNREYDKKYVYQKDGDIYTSLDGLSKALNFKYVYEKSEAKLYVNGEEYKGTYNVKGDKVYVSLKAMCETLGYYTNYNSSSNIMDISSKPISTITTQATPQANTIPYTGNTGQTGGGQGTINPGRGIDGVITLGTGLNDIKAQWGEPMGVFNIDSKSKMYIYGDLGLIPKEDGRIFMILVISQNYKTAKGIGVGSTMQQVTSAYGSQYLTAPDSAQYGGKSDETPILYPNGLMLLVNKQTQIVDSIGVFSVN